MKVCVAGTFNVIHKGHTQLLRRAFELGDEVFIGLTSDEMAEASRGVGVQSYDVREKNLVAEAQRLSGGKRFHIIRLSDPHGPAAIGNYDAIIVSKETEHVARGINDVRMRKGLKELEVIVIKMVLADDGKPVTSTRVLRGEIFADGTTSQQGP
jgi:cytidyltransferase-like protein